MALLSVCARFKSLDAKEAGRYLGTNISRGGRAKLSWMSFVTVFTV